MYNIKLFDMPINIKAYTRQNEDGTYTIILNSRLGYFQMKKSFRILLILGVFLLLSGCSKRVTQEEYQQYKEEIDFDSRVNSAVENNDKAWGDAIINALGIEREYSVIKPSDNVIQLNIVAKDKPADEVDYIIDLLLDNPSAIALIVSVTSIDIISFRIVKPDGFLLFEVDMSADGDIELYYSENMIFE